MQATPNIKNSNSSLNGMPLSSLIILCMPLALLFIAVQYLTHYNFTYTLDDPYIHLQLARNIFRGNYGINLTEPSAPSSSILWPFILAPFTALGKYFQYMPFVINCTCFIVTTQIIYTSAPGKTLQKTFATGIICVTLNLYGLVFTGMEHSLQVMLTAFIVYMLICRYTGKPLTNRAYWASIISLVLLPLIRYEGFAISFPVFIWLFSKGYRRQSLLLTTITFAAVGAFSFYLHSKGLGYLPSSIVAKSAHGLRATIDNIFLNVDKYGFVLVIVLFLSIYVYKTDKVLALVFPLATIMQFTFGKYGWYGRYEVSYLFFIILFAVNIIITDRPRSVLIMAALPLAFYSLLYPTFTTPLAAANTYNQQAQMAKIAKLVGQPVAVNDLGLVSLKNDFYVLDLWGLGSKEVLDAKRAGIKQSTWIDTFMTRKNVNYAIVYSDWFEDRPASWKKVGELKLNQIRISPALSVVSFYATNDSALVKLKQALVTFSNTNTSKAYTVTVY